MFASLGAVFIYWLIIFPIQEAERGAPEITLNAEGAVVGIAALVVGLGYLLFGPAAVRFFIPAPEKSKVLRYIVGIILGGIAAAAYFWLEHFIETKGYVFRW